MKKLQAAGVMLIVAAIIVAVTSNTFTGIRMIHLECMTFTYRILGLVGLVLLIPWAGMSNIIFDNKEQRPNENNKELIKKIRLRALLLKNLSTIILLASILTICVGSQLLFHNTSEFEQILRSMNDEKQLALNKELVWNTVAMRFSTVVLLIFLVQVLFRVFRYLLRISAYYDGVADSIELHIINENVDLIKALDILTPSEYDIRELKQRSVFETLLKVLKSK